MITLAIDTSTTRGGVALLVDGILQLDESFVADRSHSASLFSVLERARALIPGQHLDQMAIGLGPGSYAGVRIAIAAAIGFEFGLGALLLGIPSAAALETEAPHYLAIGDARRETFYFTRVEDGACLEGPLLATESELRARLTGRPDLPVFTLGRKNRPDRRHGHRIASDGRPGTHLPARTAYHETQDDFLNTFGGSCVRKVSAI
jgi:tRNA threonylcarbamoyladenosine biosynthesis protein TsaB